jgi:hypothetical protein
VPAASGPSWTQATAGLAAGLGGLVVGVGDKVGGARVGEAKLGGADPPPDGCPVVQPTITSSATATTGDVRFIFGSLPATMSVDLSWPDGAEPEG